MKYVTTDLQSTRQVGILVYSGVGIGWNGEIKNLTPCFGQTLQITVISACCSIDIDHNFNYWRCIFVGIFNIFQFGITSKTSPRKTGKQTFIKIVSGPKRRERGLRLSTINESKYKQYIWIRTLDIISRWCTKSKVYTLNRLRYKMEVPRNGAKQICSMKKCHFLWLFGQETFLFRSSRGTPESSINYE